MTDLSVVVVTHQSSEHVVDFLDAARSVAPGAEIVVVDNASSDGTPDLVAQTDPAVELIRLDRNPGFGRSCNTGARSAQGAWLLFANPDVRIRAMSLPDGTSEMPFGLGGGKLVGLAGNHSPPTVRAETTLLEDWLRAVLGRFVPSHLYTRLPIREYPPAWVCGGLFLTRRDEYLSLGGFDSRYFLYFEDRDLGARYRAAGLPVRELAGIEGVHLHGASSSGAIGPHREAWAFASWLEFLGIWRGQSAADHAAHSAIAALRAIASVGSLGMGWVRVRRKAAQVDEIIHFLATLERQLPPEDKGYYPHAIRALHKVGRRAGG
jgi:GT2 family glycosyltransferase